MNMHAHLNRARLVALGTVVVGLATAIAVVSAPDASSRVKPKHQAHSQLRVHWGVITRNTIGSPVGELRYGPYGSFGVTGSSARPPFGTGSLGIETADAATAQAPPSEKVDYGNEVDFFGDNALAINQIGFHVFQTAENVIAGGARNMPNIRIEMDANLTNPACAADNYTTMVWAPDAAPATNRWSGYIDATTTGNWYFTGAEAVCTTCTQALNCTWTQAKAALNDGPPTPFIYTVAVGKGRDNNWVGAVDGLRINSKVFDFEFFGVVERH
jgi:hypothetical protein